MFALFFCYLRAFLSGLKHYQLNNSAYKKRKKGETLKEWFLYSRYREEIPKFLLVLYFSFILMHLIGLILCIFFYITIMSLETGRIILKVMFYVDLTWSLLLYLLFWNRRNEPGERVKYSRWITKRRGKTRDEKKRK